MKFQDGHYFSRWPPENNVFVFRYKTGHRTVVLFEMILWSKLFCPYAKTDKTISPTFLGFWVLNGYQGERRGGGGRIGVQMVLYRVISTQLFE